MKYFILSIFGLWSLFGFTQKVLYTDCFLHVGNGEVIENALVGVEGDRFSLVKNALVSSIDPKKWDTIISIE